MSFVVQPLPVTNATFDDVVLTLALIPRNYLLYAGVSSMTVTIYPPNIPIVTVVTNLPSPSGAIGYELCQTGLVLSVNSTNYGEPNNFILIGTNNDGISITNWSTVAGAQIGTALTIAPVTTNNFTEGDIYFGDGPGQIDKLSADGATWTPGWGMLNYYGSVPITGLYLDQSGIFGDDLVAASYYLTYEADNSYDVGLVWLLSTNSSPSSFTQFSNPANNTTSGTITFPDNTNQWGPWAGKILVGDPDNTIGYVISTNGSVTNYYLPAEPDCVYADYFAFIPTNQNLYVVDTGYNQLCEITSTNLIPYVGDLVVSEAGDYSKLVIVAWNSAQDEFEYQYIPSQETQGIGSGGTNFTGIAFSPIDLSYYATNAP